MFPIDRENNEVGYGDETGTRPKVVKIRRITAERGTAEFGFPPSPLTTPTRLKPATITRYLTACWKRRE